MKNTVLFLVFKIFLFTQAFSQLKLENPVCENRKNPLGLDIQLPRFSWQLNSDKRNTVQTAYEIRVGSGPGKGDIWSSGKIASGQSAFVPYAGNPLQPAMTYHWQVRVWDNKGRVSDWSADAFWQMGLLKTGDWKAEWIESESPADTVNGPALLFRKNFMVSKKIASATAFITVHGMYKASINGKKVGGAELTPGWTSYNNRLQYQVYDVTPMIQSGENVIGMSVGSGWYRTPLAWNDNKNIYGRKLGLLVQVHIIYSDGSREDIVSNKNWKTSGGGPIVSSEIYNGETYDARLEKPGWNRPGYDDRDWQPAIERNYPKDILVATYNEPVTKHEVFKPVRIFTTPKGEKVVDFGQNLVGWAQLKLKGNAGDRIIVDHAEVLDKGGNFYTENLRKARASNTYILKGGEEEFFEPHFTFQGFRYIRLSGFPGEINPENISAVALYSDMVPTGRFSCSNPMLNQLQHNIQWGQKGNFLDVPTDCPQRDERLGWTGDAQAFSRTAGFNMGVHNFFSKWLKDVAADQTENGMVPFVVPNVLGPRAGGSAGWADASTIIPWNVWLCYGDKKVLEDQYESMKQWVKYMQDHSRNYLWDTGFHFGDWLFYRPADDNDGRSAVTDKYLIAQCFFAHSTQLVLNTAKLMDKPVDVKYYTDLLQNIKKAFLKEYVTGSGRLVSSTQTAYVLALQFDMLPEEMRATAAERLVKNIEDYNNHLTTGFLGTPYLCHVLTRFGYDTVAYKLLLQESYPSWLYPVKMGATTIWERWDGQKPDSSFQTPGMNSFNHYAYGAIGDWMYRNITGIDIYGDGVGYKKIRIQPHLGGGLSYADASLETVYGKLAVHWKTDNEKLLLDVTIPPNASAVVYVPASGAGAITENGKSLASQNEISVGTSDGKYIELKIGSGEYHFAAKQN